MLMLPMRDNRKLKIELLSQWKLEAEFRNNQRNRRIFIYVCFHFPDTNPLNMKVLKKGPRCIALNMTSPGVGAVVRHLEANLDR